MFNRALTAYPELHRSLTEAKPEILVPLLYIHMFSLYYNYRANLLKLLERAPMTISK